MKLLYIYGYQVSDKRHVDQSARLFGNEAGKFGILR